MKFATVLIGPPQQCSFNVFSFDIFEDHLQTCQDKSAASQVHDWVTYKMGTLLGSVGHRVKIHKITPTTDNERGDLEVKDFIFLQKPQAQDNHLPNTRSSDGAPDPDGAIKTVVMIKIRQYRNFYLHRPDPRSPV